MTAHETKVILVCDFFLSKAELHSLAHFTMLYLSFIFSHLSLILRNLSLLCCFGLERGHFITPNFLAQFGVILAFTDTRKFALDEAVFPGIYLSGLYGRIVTRSAPVTLSNMLIKFI